MINIHWSIHLLANSVHHYSLASPYGVFVRIIDWCNKCDVTKAELISDQGNSYD